MNRTLDLLSDYPGGVTPTDDDRIDAAPDELAAARRFQADPAYANRAYGRIASHGGYTWLQYWLPVALVPARAQQVLGGVVEPQG